MCGSGCQCLNCMNAFLKEEECHEEVSQLQTEGQEESDQYVQGSDGEEASHANTCMHEDEDDVNH